jgi:endo-1,4-beta-D-glucanase Y
MDDKETFDRVLKWTNDNIAKRPMIISRLVVGHPMELGYHL